MLVSNGVSVNTIPDIANTLAEAFAKTCGCDNYTPAFQALKRREERVKLNFSSSNEEGYNSPLTLRELRAALHRSGNTAAGPDWLHYIMLRHLSRSSILSLLSLFNRIWETQVFPTQWCHAHVLPFPKPGKDPTSANNYCPIALTSCLSKLMERIVSARLMFHLESHNLLSPLQSGFRKSRSTTDNLLRLETSIREAFVKKQYNISVFFDIKKAYDMSWRALIRSKLDYGSVVYSSACKSLLKILDPVHHQALRLCLRAFRTSPVESLYAEAYEPPLDLRRNKKFIIYTDSLSALQSIVSLHSLSHPILVDITYALANHLKKKDIRFCWIPGHAGITGNELADTAARSATGSSESFPIPHSDLKACFRLKLQSVCMAIKLGPTN
ncbi:putative RNA-directed DNA polymerase from transposon BS [Trichonephila clavipes]|nr:putative RNA-directed DNA polymerase from transposon BS [Trichonephila clavipes]